MLLVPLAVSVAYKKQLGHFKCPFLMGCIYQYCTAFCGVCKEVGVWFVGFSPYQPNLFGGVNSAKEADGINLDRIYPVP